MPAAVRSATTADIVPVLSVPPVTATVFHAVVPVNVSVLPAVFDRLTRPLAPPDCTVPSNVFVPAAAGNTRFSGFTVSELRIVPVPVSVVKVSDEAPFTLTTPP